MIERRVYSNIKVDLFENAARTIIFEVQIPGKRNRKKKMFVNQF